MQYLKYFHETGKNNSIGKGTRCFFRHYTCQQALKLRLRGYIKNLANSDVEIVAQGDAPQVDQLIEWPKSSSPAAEVNNIKLKIMSYEDEFPDFAILY